jgi:hypothetical protein
LVRTWRDIVVSTIAAGEALPRTQIARDYRSRIIDDLSLATAEAKCSVTRRDETFS